MVPSAIFFFFFNIDRYISVFKGQIWYKCYLVLRWEYVPCTASLSWKPLGGRLHTRVFAQRLSANVTVPVETLVIGNIFADLGRIPGGFLVSYSNCFLAALGQM